MFNILASLLMTAMAFALVALVLMALHAAMIQAVTQR